MAIALIFCPHPAGAFLALQISIDNSDCLYHLS